jgi:hypothetical protein
MRKAKCSLTSRLQRRYSKRAEKRNGSAVLFLYHPKKALCLGAPKRAVWSLIYCYYMCVIGMRQKSPLASGAIKYI